MAPPDDRSRREAPEPGYIYANEPDEAGIWNYPPPRHPDRERGGGHFYGIGPRGYQRSDERIEDDLVYRFAAARNLDTSDVVIEVRNGEVHLFGSVPDRQTKYHLEELCDTVRGVREVENRLRLRYAPAARGASTGNPP